MTDDLITDMQKTVNDARKQYGDDWELTSIHVRAGKLARLCELAEIATQPAATAAGDPAWLPPRLTETATWPPRDYETPRAYDPVLYNHESGDLWVTHPRDKQNE